MAPNTTFSRLQDATRDEWSVIQSRCVPIQEHLANRILMSLLTLDDDGDSGYAISRLEHSRQAATRAVRAGRSDGFVAMCLLHDVGLGIAPRNHGEVGGGIVRPYLADRYAWTIQNHSYFDFRYYGGYDNKDPHARDRFRGHEHYELAEEFCESFDQNSIDDQYDSLPLSDFEPLIAQVFAAGFGRAKIE